MSPTRPRIGRLRTFVALAVLAAAVAGCSGSGSIPPLTTGTSRTWREGKVVWRDLLTHDVAGSKQFYNAVFGWDFAEGSRDDAAYTTIYHRGRAIGGIVRVPREEGRPSVHQWVISISVPDVKQALAANETGGGQTLVPARGFGERGTVAVAQDRTGALVAFVRAKSGDPDDREAAIGDWLRSELWTPDPARATEQYRALLGYEVKTTPIPGVGDYSVLRSQGAPRAGIMKSPVQDARAYWMPYVRVEDPAVVAKQAAKMGGKALLEPRPDIREGTVAVIADPAGGALAVQKYPL